MTSVTGGADGTGGTKLPKIEFDVDKGTIKLENGRTFAVEINEDGIKEKLGPNNRQLLLFVKDILDTVSDQENFTFEDLSNTSITGEGVKTDQGGLKNKTITYEKYSEHYKTISSIAHQVFQSVPVLDPVSVLEKEMESSELTFDDAHRIVTGEKNLASKSVKPIVTENKEDHDENKDGELTVTISKVDSKASFSFREEGKTSSSNRGIKDKVRTVLSDIFDWFSDTKRLLSSHLETFTSPTIVKSSVDKSRSVVSEDIDSIEIDTVESFDESDILDEETMPFTQIRLPIIVKDDEKSETSEVDYSRIELKDLVTIIEEVEKYDGKVKIRDQHMRAGHRISAVKKRDKGVGSGKKSAKSMEVMLNTGLDKQKKLAEEIEKLSIQFLFLDGLDDIQKKDLAHWSAGYLDDLEKDAKLVSRSLLTEDERLRDFIEAIDEFKQDRQSEEKFETFKEKAKTLDNHLKENESEKNNLLNTIDEQLKDKNEQINLLQSLYTRLIGTTWGESVLKKNPDDLAASSTNLLKEIEKASRDGKSLEYKLHPERAPKTTTWIKYEKFLNLVFDPEEMEMRSQFETNYRWFLTSAEYVETLEKRYEENKSKLQSLPESEETEINKIIEEQRTVLQMIANWVSSTHIDSTEMDQVIKGNRTISEAVVSISNEIQSDSNYSAIHAEIQTALSPQSHSEVSLEGEVPSARNFHEQLTKVSNGMKKNNRKKFIRDFRKQLSDTFLEDMLKIQPSEFTELAWMKAETRAQSPNLSKSTDTFNIMSHYFQLSIMTVYTTEGRKEANSDQQAHMIAFLIDLQAEAIKQEDFSTSLAIESALNSSTISRLTKAWEHPKVNKENRDNRHKNSQRIISHKDNYKELRKHIDENDKAIPYIGIYLTDLTSGVENKKWKRTLADEDKTKEFNTLKLSIVSSAVEKILKFQKFNKSPQNDSSFRDEMVRANESYPDETAMYNLSLKIQPRPLKKNQVQPAA